MAKLLTYDGQVIDPTADIYIYMAITSISGPEEGQYFNFPQFYSKK